MKRALIIAAILLCTSCVYAQVGQVLPAGQILQSIKDHVARNAGCAESDLLIEYKTPLVDENLPPGEAAIEIKTGINTKFMGFTTLEVFITLDKKVHKSFLVYLEIDIKTKAYMANRWIKRYEPLTQENIGIVDTYRSKIPLDALSVDEDLSGKVAKVALGKGKIITRSSLELPPLLRNKDVVNVILENGNIKISAKAVVLMDGRLGDMVKIRLFDSKKDIYGRVVDATTVLAGSGR